MQGAWCNAKWSSLDPGPPGAWHLVGKPAPAQVTVVRGRTHRAAEEPECERWLPPGNHMQGGLGGA